MDRYDSGLELPIRAPYCRGMKRICFLLLTLSFCAGPVVCGQDAATEERLNKLSGQIEDLIASLKLQKERTSALAKELEMVREQASKPSGNYAAQEDLRRLTDAVKEVDRKRMEDNEKVKAELVKLAKSVSTPSPPSRKSNPATSIETSPTEKNGAPEKGYKYTIQKNDTLSVIVQTYREKNIKVTTDQILKANPGLDANRLRVGREIFIPAPPS